MTERQLTELVLLADAVITAQSAYLADQANFTKGRAVVHAIKAYDAARIGFKLGYTPEQRACLA